MKYCTDCKFKESGRCRAPQNLSPSPVNGEMEAKLFIMCASHRTGALTGWFNCRIFGLCGKAGRWFQPK